MRGQAPFRELPGLERQKMSDSDPRLTNPRVESDDPIHQAIVAADTSTVSTYLAGGGSATITDQYDCEPIYTAVKYDRLEIAEMLLAAGGNIDRRSKFRGNPLGAASWNWNLRMIDFCIAAGADVDTAHNGQTYLDALAAQKESIPDDALSTWQAAYDRLVHHGAKHSKKSDT